MAENPRRTTSQTVITARGTSILSTESLSLSSSLDSRGISRRIEIPPSSGCLGTVGRDMAGGQRTSESSTNTEKILPPGLDVHSPYQSPSEEVSGASGSGTSGIQSTTSYDGLPTEQGGTPISSLSGGMIDIIIDPALCPDRSTMRGSSIYDTPPPPYATL